MHRHHMKCIAFSFVNFHLMSVTIFREIISHCGDGNSTKMYPAEVKTELWGFITFRDTMKTGLYVHTTRWSALSNHMR